MLLRGNLFVESSILPDDKTQPATFFLFWEGKIGRKIGRFYPAPNLARTLVPAVYSRTFVPFVVAVFLAKWPTADGRRS